MGKDNSKTFLSRLKKNFNREIKTFLNRLERFLYSLEYPKPTKGSAKWLAMTEMKYGGFVTGVRRNKVSSDDPRSQEEVLKGGMTGGDRMYHHLYARKYVKYLKPIVKQEKSITLVEVGILKGTGLAMWCELFPNSRVIGLDIDLSHTKNNMDFLKSKGAFRDNQPELYEFDQLKDNRELLANILDGEKIDVLIDDGFHSVESILTTLRSVLPHLSKEFVYFVEDNKWVHRQLKKLYPNFLVDYSNKLNIITPN